MAKSKIKNNEGVKFTMPTFRLSFPHVFKPTQFTKNGKPQGEPFYDISMLYKKSNVEVVNAVKKAIHQAKVKAFGKDKAKWPKIKNPWTDGDEMTDLKGYEGHLVLRAKSKNKPQVVNREKEKLEDEGQLYGGCYAQAAVTIKVTEMGGNYFLTIYLQAVRKVKDGTPFGGINVKEAFDDLEDDADGESEDDSDADDSDDDDDEEESEDEDEDDSDDDEDDDGDDD